MHRCVPFALLLVIVCAAPSVQARDWFVRAGAVAGDGSRDKPFGDPWMALERVEANDKVHVTAGTYYGKLERGNWEIQFPGVELLGGYDAELRERDPWKNITELTWRKGSPNRPDVSLARVSTGTDRDTTGATIDGFLVDMKDYYDYNGDGSFDVKSLQRNGAVSLANGGVLRNCMIVNAVTAVRASSGAVVENNVIVNSIYVAISARSGSDTPATIRGNTIAFVWATKAIAEGGTEGAGIEVSNKGIVENNLVVHSDNHGAFITTPAKATFTGNSFWRNLYSNVTFYIDGKKSSLDDSDVGDAEDAGFAKAGGNVAADPKLAFDSAWYERFTRRSIVTKKLNLPKGAPDDSFAVAYPAKAVPALANQALKQGAHPKKLAVSFSTAAETTTAKTYSKIDLAALVANPKSFDGRDVELIVGFQGVANASDGPSGITTTTHKAVTIVDAKANQRTIGYVRKGTTIERIVDAIPNYGSGPPRDLFIVRANARARDGYPKHGLVLDAVTPYEAEAVASTRPKGRDWFVRAGESGGDGSRDKPFRDPFQAIEKATPGDRVLVTTGEYGGKLKSGKWLIETKYLALLGGFDRDFAKRDPWNTPSLLYWPADSKTQHQGYVVEASGDHTGFILDGFVFDHFTINTYDKDGFIDLNGSPDDAFVSLFSPESIVRNCTFVNSSGGAVRMSNAVTFENNIVANVFNEGIKVNGGFGIRPAQIRNNTFLFVYNRSRPHDGSSANGTGVTIGGQAVSTLDGNVFQYIDNFAVKGEASVSEITLTNNTFFRNWATFRSTQGTPPPTIDEKSMRLLADLPFKKVEGNAVVDAGFDIEPAFYASWFARTSQLTNRFSADEWKAIAPPTGDAKPGVGMALDWRKATKLVAKNPQAKGARPKKLEGGS